MFIKFILMYLAVINILSAIFCSYDKTQSRIHGKRVSEKNLMLLSIFGGAPTMYFTMKSTKHKTRKKKFMIGLPIIIIFQIMLVALYFYSFIK